MNKLLRALPLAGCLAAALAATGCVSSQDIEGLQSQLSDIQRQMLQMQKQAQLAPSKQEVADLGSNVGQQMQGLLKTEADMQVKLQGLGSQIEALQAKLEDTNYRLSQLSQQIASTNQQLKEFRGQPGQPGTLQPDSGAVPPAAAPPPPNGGGGAGIDPKSLYDAAYNDYLKGNFDLGVREFLEYLSNFPNTDLSDNAAYWIGESYYRQRRFRQAIEQFDTVLTRYPKGDKVPSALLKKGYSYLELNERSPGVVQLQHVIRQYPTSDEANLARQRLRELGVDAR
ncbi:MAG TPA: tol-pal system protein YbgF [Thermoanaerobaculia bacterium]|jgi:tol-pal system protein YbgF